MAIRWQWRFFKFRIPHSTAFATVEQRKVQNIQKHLISQIYLGSHSCFDGIQNYLISHASVANKHNSYVWSTITHSNIANIIWVPFENIHWGTQQLLFTFVQDHQYEKYQGDQIRNREVIIKSNILVIQRLMAEKLLLLFLNKRFVSNKFHSIHV